MEKRILSLILTLVLLLTALTGCGGGTGSPSGKTDAPPQDGTPASSGTGNSQSENTAPPSGGAEASEELYPAPDYSGFVMPEETGTLVVYSVESLNKPINTAIRLFEDAWPGVKVTCDNLDDSEFQNRIRAEIAAGKGPDMILARSSAFPDIYKTMTTRAFEDLNPYILNDAEFDLSDYIESVMDGGVMFGRRYLLPVQYQFPMILTTEEILDEIGVTAESLGTYQGFLDACTAYREKKPDGQLFPYLKNVTDLQRLFDYSGMRMIDYERNAVSFNEERFRQMIDLCRLFEGTIPEEGLSEMSSDVLSADKCLFGDSESVLLMPWDCVLLRLSGLHPVLTLATDENDGATAQIVYYSAIPGGAANKLNGWRFIKILLSDDIQYGLDDTKKNQNMMFYSGNPVRKESLEKTIRYYTSDYMEYYPDFLTEDDVRFFLEKTMAVTSAVMRPPVIFSDVRDNMTPYITGKDSYEKCLGRLMNELELYKDE
jgi:ABC-type glycerol-3-phosphate transport system substrate-binding protein